VPSIAAAIIASLAGWILDALIEPFLGIAGRIFAGIVVSAFVYVYARNWLIQLRGR
jgi:uncharacterized membrane protein YeaQ/YmgE (transglycosylase-associated protein family)